MTPSDLSGSIDIRILARLPPPLRLPIQKDGGPGLRIAQKVHRLDEATHNEQHPKNPLYIQILFNKTPRNRPYHRTPYTRQHQKRNRIFLLIRLPHIRQYPECH